MIHDHTHHPRFGAMVLNPLWPAVGEVLGCAAGRHLDVPPALQGVQAHQQVARPCPTVCVVVPHWPARSHRSWLADLADQLVGAFIDTDAWILRVIGFSRSIHDVFHAPDALRTHGGETPGLTPPGRARGFLRTRRTVSSAMASTTPSSTRRSANNGMVQHVRPVGGSLQARAIQKAACWPVNCCRAPGRGCSCQAASKPASTNRLRVRSTVDTLR